MLCLLFSLQTHLALLMLPPVVSYIFYNILKGVVLYFMTCRSDFLISKFGFQETFMVK